MDGLINQIIIHEEHLAFFFLGMTTAAPFLAYKYVVRIFRKTDLIE